MRVLRALRALTFVAALSARAPRSLRRFLDVRKRPPEWVVALLVSAALHAVLALLPLDALRDEPAATQPPMWVTLHVTPPATTAPVAVPAVAPAPPPRAAERIVLPSPPRPRPAARRGPKRMTRGRAHRAGGSAPRVVPPVAPRAAGPAPEPRSAPLPDVMPPIALADTTSSGIPIAHAGTYVELEGPAMDLGPAAGSGSGSGKGHGSSARGSTAPPKAGEGTGNARDGTGDADFDADLAEYGEALQRAVVAHKRYPRAARRLGLEGTIEVRVRVLRHGALAGAPEILESCGHAALDEEALRMVRAASPFAPLPAGYRRRSAEFIVPVRFTIR